MIKKVMLIGVLASVFLALGLVQSASAHFSIKDTETGVKAIFHVTPDHDPIAGQESVISYDFAKTDLNAEDYSYVLSVKSTKDEAVTVPVEVTGNVVLASYAFPGQGFYNISLTATDKTNGSVSVLEYGQRVSRGEQIERSKGLNLFEIGMIAGVTLIAVAAIVFSVKNDRSKQRG